MRHALATSIARAGEAWARPISAARRNPKLGAPTNRSASASAAREPPSAPSVRAACTGTLASRSTRRETATGASEESAYEASARRALMRTCATVSIARARRRLTNVPRGTPPESATSPSSPRAAQARVSAPGSVAASSSASATCGSRSRVALKVALRRHCPAALRT